MYYRRWSAFLRRVVRTVENAETKSEEKADEAEEKAKVAKIGEEELIEKKELVKELSCAPDETGKMHCTTPGAFELEETKHSKHSHSKHSHSKHSSKHSSKDRHEDRAPSHHRSEEDPEAKEPNPRDGKSTAAEMIEMIAVSYTHLTLPTILLV